MAPLDTPSPEDVSVEPRLRIPLNRVIAFIKPWINLAAAAFAAWLIAQLNVLGIDGLGEENVATWVAAALTFLATTILTELGDLKWLKGHHITIEADAQVTAAALAPVVPEVAVRALEDGTLVDPEADLADPDVSDEEEFASPPPDESNTPIQPSQDE